VVEFLNSNFAFMIEAIDRHGALSTNSWLWVFGNIWGAARRSRRRCPCGRGSAGDPD
jgi:hypothetical protein